MIYYALLAIGLAWLTLTIGSAAERKSMVNSRALVEVFKRSIVLVSFVGLFTGSTNSVPEARILRFLLSEAPAQTDSESPEARELRLTRIAKAISKHARNRNEAAALLTVGRYESHWAEFVGRGCALIPATAKASCDRGKARSYWQLWRNSCRKGWAYQRGDQRSTDAFAECAIKHFRFASRVCKSRKNHGPVAAGFAGYRTTTRCDWPPSKKRAATYRQIVGRL